MSNSTEAMVNLKRKTTRITLHLTPDSMTLELTPTQIGNIIIHRNSSRGLLGAFASASLTGTMCSRQTKVDDLSMV